MHVCSVNGRAELNVFLIVMEHPHGSAFLILKLVGAHTPDKGQQESAREGDAGYDHDIEDTHRFFAFNSDTKLPWAALHFYDNAQGKY
jgi:hypothetical protein